jgi:hypothetical protein
MGLKMEVSFGILDGEYLGLGSDDERTWSSCSAWMAVESLEGVFTFKFTQADQDIRDQGTPPNARNARSRHIL